MNKLLIPAASLFLSLGVVAGCQKDEPPPVEKPKAEGRKETQNIRNTDAVGYSGSAIANKVDDALNKNDQHVKDVEKQSQDASQDQ